MASTSKIIKRCTCTLIVDRLVYRANEYIYEDGTIGYWVKVNMWTSEIHPTKTGLERELRMAKPLKLRNKPKIDPTV